MRHVAVFIDFVFVAPSTIFLRAFRRHAFGEPRQRQ